MRNALVFRIHVVKHTLGNLVVHLFYEMLFLVNGVSFPRDTCAQRPSGMLFMTMFYTCLVTEVVYHGGTASYKKKCKIMLSHIKKYRDIHNNLVEEDLLYISSPDTTKFDVSFTQWMQNLIKMCRLKKLSKDWGTMHAKSLNFLWLFLNEMKKTWYQ